MKVSTRSRYGLRLMCQLAFHYGKGPMILKDISRSEDISEKYLGHLIVPLKGVGLIRSSKGAHGGYVLARHPKEITLLEIIKILEGDISLVECTKDPSICKQVDRCPTRSLWCALSDVLTAFLQGKTLQDMIDQSKKTRGAFSYSI